LEYLDLESSLGRGESAGVYGQAVSAEGVGWGGVVLTVELCIGHAGWDILVTSWKKEWELRMYIPVADYLG